MSIRSLLLDVYNQGFELSIRPDKANRYVSLVLSKAGCRSVTGFEERELNSVGPHAWGTDREIEAEIDGLIARLEDSLQATWVKDQIIKGSE